MTIEEPRGIIHGQWADGRQQGANAQAQVRRPRHLRSRTPSPPSECISACLRRPLRRSRSPRCASSLRRARRKSRSRKADQLLGRHRRRQLRDRSRHRSTGNVVITQGTLTIRADRIVFKQNPDNSMSVTAYGNPVRFRQKRDGFDEYYEGFAQTRRVRRRRRSCSSSSTVRCCDAGQDEIRSNYISYNTSTGAFKAEGRPTQPGAADGSGRARARRVPAALRRAARRPAKDAAKASDASDAAPATGGACDGASPPRARAGQRDRA